MLRRKYVFTLYKSILRLHRALPPEAKVVGDLYVREEFRRHKAVNAAEAEIFLKEWSEYAVTLAKQLGPSGIRLSSTIGRNLTEKELNMLAEDQLSQLYELYQASEKLKQNDNTNMKS